MSLTKARELRQERAKLYDEAKADVEANPDGFTPEEQERWDKRMSRMDELQKEYETLETNHEQLRSAEESLRAKQDYLDTEREFGEKREDAEEQAAEYREAFTKYLREEMSARELRAIAKQTKGTAGLGGNTVPTDMEASVITGLKAFGGMRQVANIISTPDGRNLDFPTSDDTGNVATIVAEATAITASTHVPFSKLTMEAVKYKSGPIKISRELVQDSVIDVGAYVQGRMIERFARGTNAHYTTRSSTEAAGPHGITNDSTGAVAVANNAITPENLITLIHSVDPAYRMGSGYVGFMTNDAGVAEVRKLRWGSSRQFVWEPSGQVGTPDMLLGYPVTLNQDVPLEGTTGNKWLWFGNFNHYYIRDVQGIDLVRLEERYAEEDVIAYLGYMRTDGRRMTGSTVIAQRPYRCILHSS